MQNKKMADRQADASHEDNRPKKTFGVHGLYKNILALVNRCGLKSISALQGLNRNILRSRKSKVYSLRLLGTISLGLCRETCS